MTKAILRKKPFYNSDGSALVPFAVFVHERPVLQHPFDAIRHEVTCGMGTKQPHLVMLPDVGIHRWCIVGEVPAM